MWRACDLVSHGVAMKTKPKSAMKSVNKAMKTTKTAMKSNMAMKKGEVRLYMNMPMRYMFLMDAKGRFR